VIVQDGIFLDLLLSRVKDKTSWTKQPRTTFLIASLKRFTKLFQHHFSTLKKIIIQEITSSSKRTLESDVTERISTKLKQNETPHFKRQFNRQQHNHKVINAIVVAQDQLRREV